MKVSEIMTRDVVVVRPDDTLQQAAKKMRDQNFGSMPVCDGTRLQGMITDRDITIRAVAEGKDATTTKCRDIMTDDLYYARESDSVKDVAKKMRDRQVRRLPIVDGEQNLVGIVAIGDLATEAGNDKRTGDTLEGISQPS